MSSPTRGLFFASGHDDLVDASYAISIQAKTSPSLSTFLRAAGDLVRREAQSSNGTSELQSFEDVIELAEQHILQGRHSSVTEMTITVILQIAQLIVFAERDCTVLSTQTLTFSHGLGSIPQAVADSSSSLRQTHQLGLQAVKAVYLLAVELSRLSQFVEKSTSPFGAAVISAAVEGLEAQMAAINIGLRPINQIYIGQRHPSHVVVFGPPTTLERLSQLHKSTKHITPLPMHRTLMHGAHLASLDDAKLFDHSDFDFVRDALEKIAFRPSDVSSTVQTLTSQLRTQNSAELNLTSIGSAKEAAAVAEELGKAGVLVEHVLLHHNLKPFGNNADTVPSDAIAVVGMSGRFPESDTLDELWQLLKFGATVHKEIPDSRFNLDDFYDPSRKSHNSLVQRYGCFIKTPGAFDHRLFNISPREAQQMDPVQRMLLMTTYEALEMAGYSDDGQQKAPRIATYFGQTIDDWKTINDQQGIDTHYLPGVNRGFAPGRLCHYFKWAGGFYSIDTGCSSSATSVCIARDALANGDIDAAVVGGGTLLAAPEWFSGLGQGGVLSPTGACKTFTDQADGYCRGEGVAVVVLKRLSDAIRSKDNVLAVIAGASRNTNAGEGSITHPGAKAQEALYRRALRQACVRPTRVNVIEMHGTGTQAGDRTETTALRNVFAPPHQQRRTQPPIVGALKANIGHSEAAAGVVSLIKAILLLHCQILPPQPNQDMQLNPYLKPILGPGGDMQLSNGQAWPSCEDDLRYVFINNFDAAGGNVSMVIHQAPGYAQPALSNGEDLRGCHVVVVAAKTEKSLAENKSRLAEYLRVNPSTSISDLAYTTAARRMVQPLKEAFVAGSIVDLLDQLAQPSKPSQTASNVVFAFTGQGSQYAGMGCDLYRSSGAFKMLIDSYQQLLKAQGIDCPLVPVILGNEEQMATDERTRSRNAQVALVALEIALAQYLQSLGLKPSLVIGHSLGEYSALCIANVLSVGDALALTFERAELIFRTLEPSKNCMMAVSLPADTLRWRIRDLPATSSTCEICCINSPSSTVVGGPIAAIDALEDYLKTGDNASCTRLKTQYAFHTREMDPLLAELETRAAAIRYHSPTVPVASTLLAKVVSADDGSVFNAEYVRRHTREAVAFSETVRICEEQGLVNDESLVIEIGPQPICINLLGASLNSAKPTRLPSLRRGHNDWESILQCLAAGYRAQLPVSWSSYYNDHLDQVRLVSGLPTYAFDLQTFWTPYQTQATKQLGTAADAKAKTVKLSSASVHAVQTLSRDGSKLSATFTADLADPVLGAAIMGHIVDGVAICPASVFIDMAYTAASYLEAAGEAGHSICIAAYELLDLEMTTPMILRPGMTAEEIPQVTMTCNLDEITSTVSVQYSSKKASNGHLAEHGSCLLRLKQSTVTGEQSWSRLQPLIQARIRTLETSLRPRHVHALDRKLFYKVFSEIVDYAAPYHAVEEAIIAADFNDGTFTFQTQANDNQNSYTCNPFLVDAAIHVAGFLLNADVAKPKEVVHIANHIGSLHILRQALPAESLYAYATIREQDPKTHTSMCDVYVKDAAGKLVVACSDICFKELNRDFFAMLTGSNRAVANRSLPTQNPKLLRGRSALATPLSSNDASTRNSSTGSSPSLSSQSDTVDLASELLSAVVIRSGISWTDIKSNSKATFADMGVDSQMSIQILADFQAATAVELPAAFFNTFPTPADVEKELGNQDLDQIEPLEAKKVTRQAPVKQRKERGQLKPVSTRSSGPSKQLFEILADALGVEKSAFVGSTTFESLGLDSMLSIRALSSFYELTDIELPAAFFSQFRTVGEAQKELDEGSDQLQRALETRTHVQPKVTPIAPAPVLDAREQKIETAVSRAVLIQGSSRSKTTPLFMTTDGSGTVESYIHLKALPEGRRLYALESPFLLETEKFDLSIEEMARIFVRTIRRIQPQGPYLIGGWSAGSIYAYEVAHSLTRAGEDILALIVLDMRAPSLIPTAIVAPDFVVQLGTFEGINRARDLPEDLSVKEKAHLMATCRALSRYDAPAFAANKRPRHSAVVWARLGLDDREDASPACMLRPGLEMGKRLEDMELEDFKEYFNSWFYGKRSTFGKNGWDEFLGDNIDVFEVDGDHFSMMTPPFSDNVGQIVVDMVQKATIE